MTSSATATTAAAVTTPGATSGTTAPPGAERLVSTDPATGDVVGSVTVTPVDQVPDRAARARAAQPAWAALTAAERADRIRPVGAVLAERAEEIGLLLSREMGKPLAEAVGEVRHCGTALDAELDEIVAALAPETLADAQVRSTIHHDPFGVCAAITPWNFPVAMPHSLVIPALVAGNAVILKPSEETPLVAQAYVDCFAPFLPPDVLQIVHGADAQGKALVAADVDLVAFTGSRAVGARILEAAAPALKRVVLELGGKDPMIVLDDADVSKAAHFAARNSFRNAGQVCVSTERIYVADAVADAFEAALLRFAGEIRQGPGTAPETSVGPMVNARQRDHVLVQLERARRQGARVLCGGTAEGNFIRPTVLADVTHDMEIMTEETFGPVACVMRVRDDDEAVRLANDTPYGLGACVFGGDPERAQRVARRLTAGMIGINKGCGGATGAPWVGARQSGYGFHSGRDGHRQFAQTRVVSVGA